MRRGKWNLLRNASCKRVIYITQMYSLLLQRGSDELLSQSGAVSNGASMSPQPHHAADNNNDAKKVSGFN